MRAEQDGKRRSDNGIFLPYFENRDSDKHTGAC